jgi:glucose-6-phosphate 1-epimerase
MSYEIITQLWRMKLSVGILVASLSSASSFYAGHAPAFYSTALSASRNRDKIISRTKWADARGYKDEVNKAAVIAGGLMKNEQGLEYVKLVHPSGSTSDVYVYGGCVTSYIDATGTEYIAVRPDAKMDGSKPISGGLSHCWPQFGPGKIQQHGFARNVNWNVVSMSSTSVTLQMAPSDYTKAIWDKNFLCTFVVTLEEDQLSTKMIVDNKDAQEPFDFQAALHSYFTVSSLENLEVTGSFQGKQFLNKLVNGGTMQTEERNAIVIGEEYDRVYMGVNDPVLQDKGTSKKVRLIQHTLAFDYILGIPPIH